jgi:hypothetical protein
VLRFVVPLALAAVLTACGTDDSPDAADPTTAPTSPVTTSTAADPTTDPTTDPATDPASGWTPPAAYPTPVTIRPGQVGKVRVGMSLAEGRATGQLEDGAALCGELVRWTGNPDGFLVLNDRSRRISQITVSVPGPRTERGGIQVGSTYGELRAAFPGLTKPVADGWDGASVYPPGEEDGRAYLGFLLLVPPAQVTDRTPVIAIAATGGDKPYFQYDC